MPQPKKLPPKWEYQESTDCVVCGCCCFRYGAEHADSDGDYTCPNCGDKEEQQETAMSEKHPDHKPKPKHPAKPPEREHKPRPMDDDAMPPIITPDLPS